MIIKGDPMTVTVTWLDEAQTIVHYQIDPDWTWETFYPALDEALAMERCVDWRVDVIVELPTPLRIPAKLMTHLTSIARKQPDNLHKSVLVSRNTVVRSLLSVAGRLSPTIATHYIYAETADDALRYIYADRDSTGA